MNTFNSISRQSTTLISRLLRLSIFLASIAANADLLAQYNGSFEDVRAVAGLESIPGQQFASDISDDGLTISFSSYNGRGALYQATRDSLLDPFDEPVKIDSLNQAGPENFGQTLSSDGLTTYFSSGTVGGAKSSTWTAVRDSREADWGIAEAFEIDVDAVRTGSLALSDDDLTIYYSASHGGTDAIFTVTRPSSAEPFSDPEPISELNSPSKHRFSPTISSDELAILFSTTGSSVSTMIATRSSRDEPFGRPIDLDNFGLGSQLNSQFQYSAFPVLAPNWPDDGSKLYFTTNRGGFDIYEATWRVESLPGDFNGDGLLDIVDLEQLTSAIRSDLADSQFDLDQSGTVSPADRNYWVTELKSTWIGDANLDGVFDSGDFVNVFATNKYETGETATWSEGDWNGDERFDSGDFVVAFAGGGYEMGTRTAAAVPEPASQFLTTLSLVTVGLIRRRSMGPRLVSSAALD